MRLDRLIRSFQQIWPRRGCVVCGTAPQFRQIFDARCDPRNALVVQRSRLPALRHGVSIGTDLIRMQARQMLAFAVEHTHVRPKEFVGRAGKKIAIQLANVNRPVRGVVHCVDVRNRACVARHADDGLHVVDGANRVRRVSHGDNPATRRELAREVVQVKRAVFFVDVHELNLHPAFFERLPGRDVRAVVELREQNLVAGAEVAADSAADRERQRSHVLPEDDFVRIAAQEISHRGARAGDDLVGLATGRVLPVGIGVAGFQIMRNGVDHALRDLRAARAVEESWGTAVDRARERGELRADPREIERSFHVVAR